MKNDNAIRLFSYVSIMLAKQLDSFQTKVS